MKENKLKPGIVSLQYHSWSSFIFFAGVPSSDCNPACHFLSQHTIQILSCHLCRRFSQEGYFESEAFQATLLAFMGSSGPLWTDSIRNNPHHVG